MNDYVKFKVVFQEKKCCCCRNRKLLADWKPWKVVCQEQMRVVSVCTSFSTYQVTHAPGGARLQSCENQLPATKGERRKKMMGNKEYLLEFLRYTRSSLDVTQKGTERRRRRQEMAILFLIGNRSADERRTYRCILTHANRRYIENIPFYTACNVYIII